MGFKKSQEENFKPSNLKAYKRGEIIKANLGFNVGAEFGGLHYCVVVSKDNSIYNPVITIVPLTSVKNDITKSMHKGNLLLGTTIFDSLMKKLETTRSECGQLIETCKKTNLECEQERAHILQMVSQNTDKDKILQSQNSLATIVLQNQRNLMLTYEKLNEADRMINELKKMKKGSIALVSQITTISKIRIYNPKRGSDTLANVRVSNENMNMIDAEIRELYTLNKQV